MKILVILFCIILLFSCTTTTHLQSAYSGEDIILIEITEEKEPNWFISLLVGISLGYGLYYCLENIDFQ